MMSRGRGRRDTKSKSCFQRFIEGLQCCVQCIRCGLKWLHQRKTYQTIVNVMNLSGHIPGILYTTDFRLVFILTAIYTSLVSQFRQAANSEADRDVESDRLFEISPEWPNHSVSGGVSDRVLWNCRAGSQTNTYYKTIYLGLIIIYVIIVAAYLITKTIINIMAAQSAFKLRYGPKGKKVRYLEVVANGLKSLDQFYDRLTKARDEARENEAKRVTFEATIKKLIEDWNKKWNQLTKRTKDSHYLYNWLTVLYLIPRYETLLLLMILTFSLTSYDIHPIGCLSPIHITYNEAEMSVILTFSDDVIRYQRASVLLIVILALHWLTIKVFQFLLLPRVKWGLRINKVCKGEHEDHSQRNDDLEVQRDDEYDLQSTEIIKRCGWSILWYKTVAKKKTALESKHDTQRSET